MENKPFVFRFSDVEVREREFSLVKAGEVIPVEPKAFRVLLFLLHNPQKLITKEELLNAVWGETAVSENSLTRSIALLRRLLGDDTHQPRYIETVATVGYRFVCPVEVSEDALGGLAAPDPMPVGNGSEPAQINDGTASEVVSCKLPARTIWTTRRGWLLAAIVLGVGLLASAFWYLTRTRPPLRVTESARIIHNSNWKFLAGTDGARLYLTDSMRFYGGWEPSMYQAAIDGGTLEQLSVGPHRTWIEDVSPDGSALLVRLHDVHDQLGLWSLQIPGGAIRHLADTAHQFASWSPDGKSAIYWTDKMDIGVVQSDGTAAHILVPAKALGEPSNGGRFAWSPNGKAIRFTKDRKLWEMSSDGSEIHPLLPNWQPSKGQGGGQWTPDGKFFVFYSYEIVPEVFENSVGQNQLWALDERHSLFRQAPTKPVQLTSGPIRWVTPIISNDGKKIYARGLILDGELERFDAQSQHFQSFLGGISAEFVSFSQDGKFVAYVTYPDGTLWSANRDGSNRMQLTNPPFYPRYPRWSPDGTQLLFMATDANGDFKAFLVPSHERGTPQALLPEDKGVQTDPYWSPDGRRVVLVMESPSAPEGNLRILDLASHQLTILPESVGMYEPRWSPDGRFIAADESAKMLLKVFDFETQRWSTLHEGGSQYPAFSQDGQYIYFVFWGENLGVYRVRPSGGKAEQVVDLTDFRWTGSLSEWMGLDPTDAPMLLRDIGSDDIYALTLDEK